VVEDFLGSLLGPLPTGLLKPSKALVTNLGDKASEAIREMQFFGSVSPCAHRISGASAKDGHTTFWKCGTGRATT